MPGDDITPNGNEDEADFERDVEGEAGNILDAGSSAFVTDRSPALPAGARARLSVAIATYRRPSGLRRLLAALRPQVEAAPNREIVVVNDGSHDEAYAAAVAEFADIVRYVPLPENVGVGPTRNRCVTEATGEFVVFVDDDCEPPVWWLDRLEAQLEERPDLDVVAGTTTPLWQKRSFLERVQAHYELHPHPWPEGEFHLFVTANVALRRSLVEELGGFAPLRGGEDSELSVRLAEARAHTLIDWNWHVRHEVGGKFADQMRRFWGYGYFNVLMTRLPTAPASSNALTQPQGDILLRIREHIAKSRGFSRSRVMCWLAAAAAATFGLAHYSGCAAASRALRRERAASAIRRATGDEQLESAEPASEV